MSETEKVIIGSSLMQKVKQTYQKSILFKRRHGDDNAKDKIRKVCSKTTKVDQREEPMRKYPDPFDAINQRFMTLSKICRFCWWCLWWMMLSRYVGFGLQWMLVEGAQFGPGRRRGLLSVLTPPKAGRLQRKFYPYTRVLPKKCLALNVQ